MYLDDSVSTSTNEGYFIIPSYQYKKQITPDMSLDNYIYNGRTINSPYVEYRKKIREVYKYYGYGTIVG
jgi:hypothetical protein